MIKLFFASATTTPETVKANEKINCIISSLAAISLIVIIPPTYMDLPIYTLRLKSYKILKSKRNILRNETFEKSSNVY